MGKQSRRDFLKKAGILGAALSGIKPKEVKAAPKNILSEDRMGVLVDTTYCIGCRRCEYACKNSHDIPTGNLKDYDDRSIFEKMRRPHDKALTVVNEYSETDKSNPINVKVQCMHCDNPACVSACIVGAFSKQENGAIVYNASTCIGCRYCMIACPFQIPAYEFENALTPEVKKCDFCFERQQEGKLPACVEICPVEALTFGKRRNLLSLAEERIEQNPDRYYNHIYGKNEVGGTSWMYISAQEPSKLDFPKLGNDPAPGVSESIQHGIFAYFVPPLALYALLGGIMWITKNNNEAEGEK